MRGKRISLTLILIAAISSTLSAQQVKIETKQARAGDTASLQVSVEGLAQVAGLQLELKYDEIWLQLVAMEGGEILGGSLSAHNPSRFPDRSGVYRFGGVRSSGFGGSGVLLKLLFAVDDSARGTVPVRFTSIKGANIDLQDVVIAGTNGGFEIAIPVTSVETLFELPKEFELHQNYPNPFNPSTIFQLALPVPSRVKIHVYNILGQVVAELLDEEKREGYHQITWNPSSISSSVYFVRMHAESLDRRQTFTLTRKTILLR